MKREKPSLEGVNPEEDGYRTEPYLHHNLDHLLDLAGSKGYTGCGLLRISGNVPWNRTLGVSGRDALKSGYLPRASPRSAEQDGTHGL